MNSNAHYIGGGGQNRKIGAYAQYIQCQSFRVLFSLFSTSYLKCGCYIYILYVPMHKEDPHLQCDTTGTQLHVWCAQMHLNCVNQSRVYF